MSDEVKLEIEVKANDYWLDSTDYEAYSIGIENAYTAGATEFYPKGYNRAVEDCIKRLKSISLLDDEDQARLENEVEKLQQLKRGE